MSRLGDNPLRKRKQEVNVVRVMYRKRKKAVKKRPPSKKSKPRLKKKRK